MSQQGVLGKLMCNDKRLLDDADVAKQEKQKHI